MSSNPMIPQGTLNRLRGTVNFAANPQLNVTAPYLGKAGITMSLEGESTLMIPTMSGTVTSPEPYMMVSCVVNILKTQNLASVFKAQMEKTTVIGDVVVTSDTTTLPTYYLNNCAIESVREMSFNGEDAGFAITIKGYYIINNDSWSIA
jgi:hypothetical protein